MKDCAEAAEKILETLRVAGASSSLRDDPHVRTCAACRAMLERELATEAALALAGDVALPAGLAARVTARLAPARDVASIGVWLDLATGPVDVPHDLADRVGAGVARRRARRGVLRRTALAIAAAIAVGTGALFLRDARRSPDGSIDVAAWDARLDDPGDDLLARLELFEDWDLIVGDASDMASFLGALDELDLWLIESAGLAEDPAGTFDARRG